MRRFVLLACAVNICVADTRAQQPLHLANILQRLAGRTQEYYDRFISIICTETVETQNLRFNRAPTGRPRVTVYELSISRESEANGDAEFRVDRLLLSVNGRAARKNQRPECTDPKTGTPEPLGFLLSSHQRQYRFTVADPGDGPEGTRALDFIETPPQRVRVEWHGSCFEAEGGGHEGRVWFDPATYDVRQVLVRLSKPFQVPLPDGFFGIRPPIRVEKSEMILTFAPVNFQQPEEAVMLPASIETVHVLRGVPSMRIRQTLADYRRFLTKSEIRPGGGF